MSRRQAAAPRAPAADPLPAAGLRLAASDDRAAAPRPRTSLALQYRVPGAPVNSSRCLRSPGARLRTTLGQSPPPPLGADACACPRRCLREAPPSSRRLCARLECAAAASSRRGPAPAACVVGLGGPSAGIGFTVIHAQNGTHKNPDSGGLPSVARPGPRKSLDLRIHSERG